MVSLTSLVSLRTNFITCGRPRYGFCFERPHKRCPSLPPFLQAASFATCPAFIGAKIWACFFSCFVFFRLVANSERRWKKAQRKMAPSSQGGLSHNYEEIDKRNTAYHGMILRPCTAIFRQRPPDGSMFDGSSRSHHVFSLNPRPCACVTATGAHPPPPSPLPSSPVRLSVCLSPFVRPPVRLIF